jgi:sugar-specific transcriptional regulator TrmB
MQINYDYFKNLDFSKNEVKVYLSLHRLKKAKASNLIKESKLQRSVVYPALEKLITRGLVSKTLIRGVASFSFNSPDSLIRESMDKVKIATTLSEQLKIIGDLKPRESFVYEGNDVILKVSEQTLEAENGDIVYFLGPSKYGSQANLEKYWSKYHKRRLEKSIKCKILYDKHTPKEIVDNRNNQPLCEAKYMPFGFDLPFWIVIYKDTVAMVVPGEDPPLAFIIRSSNTAKGFIQYFEYLWSNNKNNRDYFSSF